MVATLRSGGVDAPENQERPSCVYSRTPRFVVPAQYLLQRALIPLAGGAVPLFRLGNDGTSLPLPLVRPDAGGSSLSPVDAVDKLQFLRAHIWSVCGLSFPVPLLLTHFFSFAMTRPCFSSTGTASLELIPVGGRLSIVALLPPSLATPTETDVGGLTEEFDKLGLGRAHTASAAPQRTPLRGLSTRQQADRREGQGGERDEEAKAPAAGGEWSFRLHQQSLQDGQQVRLSIWRAPQTSRASDFPNPPSGVSLREEPPAEAALSDDVTKCSSSEDAEAPTRQQQSACNFYFRMPCALPALTVLGASYAATRRATLSSVITADEEQQHAVPGNMVRLSLQCSLRPSSLSEALQRKEDRSIRGLSAFRLTCRCALSFVLPP